MKVYIIQGKIGIPHPDAYHYWIVCCYSNLEQCSVHCDELNDLRLFYIKSLNDLTRREYYNRLRELDPNGVTNTELCEYKIIKSSIFRHVDEFKENI